MLPTTPADSNRTSRQMTGDGKLNYPVLPVWFFLSRLQPVSYVQHFSLPLFLSIAYGIQVHTLLLTLNNEWTCESLGSLGLCSGIYFHLRFQTGRWWCFWYVSKRHKNVKIRRVPGNIIFGRLIFMIRKKCIRNI